MQALPGTIENSIQQIVTPWTGFRDGRRIVAVGLAALGVMAGGLVAATAIGVSVAIITNPFGLAGLVCLVAAGVFILLALRLYYAPTWKDPEYVREQANAFFKELDAGKRNIVALKRRFAPLFVGHFITDREIVEVLEQKMQNGASYLELRERYGPLHRLLAQRAKEAVLAASSLKEIQLKYREESNLVNMQTLLEIRIQDMDYEEILRIHGPEIVKICDLHSHALACAKTKGSWEEAERVLCDIKNDPDFDQIKQKLFRSKFAELPYHEFRTHWKEGFDYIGEDEVRKKFFLHRADDFQRLFACVGSKDGFYELCDEFLYFRTIARDAARSSFLSENSSEHVRELAQEFGWELFEKVLKVENDENLQAFFDAEVSRMTSFSELLEVLPRQIYPHVSQGVKQEHIDVLFAAHAAPTAGSSVALSIEDMMLEDSLYQRGKADTMFSETFVSKIDDLIAKSSFVRSQGSCVQGVQELLEKAQEEERVLQEEKNALSLELQESLMPYTGSEPAAYIVDNEQTKRRLQVEIDAYEQKLIRAREGIEELSSEMMLAQKQDKAAKQKAASEQAVCRQRLSEALTGILLELKNKVSGILSSAMSVQHVEPPHSIDERS